MKRQSRFTPAVIGALTISLSPVAVGWAAVEMSAPPTEEEQANDDTITKGPDPIRPVPLALDTKSLPSIQGDPRGALDGADASAPVRLTPRRGVRKTFVYDAPKPRKPILLELPVPKLKSPSLERSVGLSVLGRSLSGLGNKLWTRLQTPFEDDSLRNQGEKP